MVAITVILAVVVFALVSRLAQTNSNQSPKVNVASEDANGQGGVITILSIANNAGGGGMQWSQMSFSGAASCSISNPGSTVQGTAVRSGDVIHCTGNGPWNMVWTPSGGTGVVVSKGNFPSS